MYPNGSKLNKNMNMLAHYPIWCALNRPVFDCNEKKSIERAYISYHVILVTCNLSSVVILYSKNILSYFPYFFNIQPPIAYHQTILNHLFPLLWHPLRRHCGSSPRSKRRTQTIHLPSKPWADCGSSLQKPRIIRESMALRIGYHIQLQIFPTKLQCQTLRIFVGSIGIHLGQGFFCPLSL